MYVALFLPQSAVKGFLGIVDYEDSKESELFADWMLHVLAFAQENGFDVPKASAWFTIMKITFAEARGGGGAGEYVVRLVHGSNQHSSTACGRRPVVYAYLACVCFT